VKIGNKAQKGAVVIVAVGASVTISRRERIAIAVLAPVDREPVVRQRAAPRGAT